MPLTSVGAPPETTGMKKSVNSNPDPLALLRAELKKRKLSGFIVPRQDEFQGEYVAPYAERLRWLTGFAGSWGTAIVTRTKAAIFVDGRYTVQVRSQVDVKRFEPRHLVDQPPAQWIEENLKNGDRLGYDPWLLTAEQAARFAKACAKAGAKLVPVDSNPLDAVWLDRPPRPLAPVTSQPTQFAGRTVREKLDDAVAALNKAKAGAVVLTMPDSVAWLFNIRGTDVSYTPVVLANAILHRKGKAELFIDASRLAEDARAQLRSVAILRKPETIDTALKALGTKKSRVLLDLDGASEHVRAKLAKSGAVIVAGADPCVLPKARKNAIEQEGARAAHRRDGIAMARFLRWLEAAAPAGALTELAVADKLEEFRRAHPLLLDLSFDTIAGAGPNGALPHYKVSAESSRPLNSGDIFLIDSGAQYQDGTTDITRTVIIGQPTDEMKDRFTRVLKGMIGLSRIRFPKGTCGSQLDVLARQHLWTAGLEYDHGTGHGVGSYLSVHEGPARINKSDRTPLEPGMILSNEPGFYRPDHYGIRIENLLLVTAEKEIEGGERPMLGFETLTLCPIDRRLIDRKLLDSYETSWLDAYHARVLKEVGDHLDGGDLDWMRQACSPLG